MNEELKALLFGLLRVQTKKTDAELQQLLFEGEGEDEKLKADSLSTLKGIDAQRVSTLKMDDEALKKLKGDEFNKGYQKAQGETMSKLEKEAKQKYGFESEKQGLELFIDLIDNEKSKASGKEGEITDDQVQSHPMFVKLKSDHKVEIDTVKTDMQKKIDDQVAEYQTKEMFGEIESLARGHWKEQNAVFSENATIANNTQKVILDRLGAFKYQKNGDTYVPLDSEGKVIDNGHGHPVTLEEHIRKHTSDFATYQKVKQRSSTGNDDVNDDPPKKTATAYKGPIPKNDDEFITMMEKAETPEDRIAINNAYQESKSS